MPDETNQQQQQAAQTPQPVQAAQPQVVVQAAPATVSTSGLAVAGMVLGIIAFLISFIPLMNLGSVIMGLLGLVLAIAGLVSTRNGKHKGKGIAIAGIVLGLLALVVTFVMYGSVAAISESNSKTVASDAAPASSAAQETGESEEAQVDEPQAEEAAESADETTQADYVVNIDGARLGQDYEGKDVAIVTYSWQNNSDDTESFWLVFTPKVFQNGVEVGTGVSLDIDSDGYMADVKPGGGTTFEIAYEVKDRSDITVEITQLFDWDDEVVAEQTFSLE